MVFSDSAFIILFFPIVTIIYFILSNSAQKAWLTLTSFFFYYVGGGYFVILLFLSCLLNWSFGLFIEKRRSVLVFTIGILANLIPLFIFKYTNFIIENINHLLTVYQLGAIQKTNIILPIGISFYTFQGVSYLFDIYRKEIDALRNPIDYFFYLSFFTQLIAGPIVRFQEIAPQIFKRTSSLEDISAGLSRFAWGLAKKVLIADSAARFADAAFGIPSNELTFWTAWLGAVAFAVQIYFDFSGYSDMAIGMGRMFGFHFSRNFFHPYAAASITDFWRRWHISLSSWFRDYLYIPLGGNRKSKTRTIFNLWAVFAVTGLWHGAAWNYICWGLLHGFYLTCERLFSLHRWQERLPSYGWRLYALLLVLIAWVLFRAPTLATALDFYDKMLAWPDSHFGLTLELYRAITFQNLLFFSIGCLSFFATAHWTFGEVIEKDQSKAMILRLGTIVILFPVCVIEVMTQGFRPFLYFQF